MKNRTFLFSLTILFLLCAPDIQAQSPQKGASRSKALTFEVNGVKLNMIHVEGGSFDMGLTEQERKEISMSENEEPMHNVQLASYYLCETEVTEALFNAVLGIDGGSDLPRSGVTRHDCDLFLSKLNELTGKQFRLPTEAEWEYAARGGKRSQGYPYAGSNDAREVAWYKDNSGGKAHPVKGKQSNELGLYDMSGNVAEWCSDKTGWNDDYYAVSPWVNPQGYEDYYIYQLNVVKADHYIVRGGCYTSNGVSCYAAVRNKEHYNYHSETTGFRIALSDEKNADPRKNDNTSGVTITANGVCFKMIRVDGGTFTMGFNDTDRQKETVPYENSTEVTHTVKVSSFYIGETEVTQALWTAVMGAKKDNFRNDAFPAVGVSWDECQEFIQRLNQLTGHIFRLPTEAEWEFAARGGKKSQGFLYAGSDNAIDAGWSWANMLGSVQPVATKKPNELGLYDMTGNVAEWCSDWYEEQYYRHSPKSNPQGPEEGKYRVCRGGYWNNDPFGIYVRQYEIPTLHLNEMVAYSLPYNGLRLVMVK